MTTRLMTGLLLAAAAVFVAVSFVPGAPRVWMLVLAVAAGGAAIFVTAKRE